MPRPGPRPRGRPAPAPPARRARDPRRVPTLVRPATGCSWRLRWRTRSCADPARRGRWACVETAPEQTTAKVSFGRRGSDPPGRDCRVGGDEGTRSGPSQATENGGTSAMTVPSGATTSPWGSSRATSRPSSDPNPRRSPATTGRLAAPVPRAVHSTLVPSDAKEERGPVRRPHHPMAGRHGQPAKPASVRPCGIPNTCRSGSRADANRIPRRHPARRPAPGS